jgi:hypothetical protein
MIPDELSERMEKFNPFNLDNIIRKDLAKQIGKLQKTEEYFPKVEKKETKYQETI